MIYLIKFCYAWLLPPAVFFLLFVPLIVSLWRANRRQAVYAAGIMLVMYLFSMPAIGEALVRSLEYRYRPPAAVTGDVILMLGGGSTRSTPDIDGQGQLSGAAANRLLTAVRLHKKTGLPILLSGGRVYAGDGNESVIARRQMLALGVPADSIIVEGKSRTTIENVQYTRAILSANHYRRPILVTSALHMPRAVMAYRRSHIQVIPYPTDYTVNPSPSFNQMSIVPGGFGSAAVCKEYLGMLAIQCGL